MAINICSESPIVSLCSSPRISFSHDLDHSPPLSHPDPARSDHTLLPERNPDFAFSDFDFCLPASGLDQQTSPADELFSGGIIIPTHQRKDPKITNPIPNPLLQSSQGNANHKVRDNEEEEAEQQPEMSTVTTKTKVTLVREEKSQCSKSLWGFKRSSSLNCDSANGQKKSSIWSSLPLLSRSNSTGSDPKQSSGKATSSTSSSSSSSINTQLLKPQSLSSPHSGNQNAAFHHKRPPRKSYGGCGLGPMPMSATSSPVLNVPPPYITKGTSDLLGLGSLFRNGKDKKTRKR